MQEQRDATDLWSSGPVGHADQLDFRAVKLLARRSRMTASWKQGQSRAVFLSRIFDEMWPAMRYREKSNAVMLDTSKSECRYMYSEFCHAFPIYI